MAEHPRRFSIRTFGCQMNVHDSDKLSNLLYHAGLEACAAETDADFLVINTCSVRDKAENRLYSELGLLKDWKEARPGRVIGVGGCVAQQEGEAILRRFPQVDLVFGTHNLRSLPAMLDGAFHGRRESRTEEIRGQERFDLPERHPSYSGLVNARGVQGDETGQAFVTVMEGCDMFCSFCVVPRTRGREISRRAGQILAEAESLVARGIREITLLGQTVNAYGRHDVRRDGGVEAGTIPFAELLTRLDAIPGLDRIRYTSPHPCFVDDDLIRAHAEFESLCPHLHLPVQSGSSATLARMRRRYSREEYLEIVGKLRAARPDIVLTSDLIVGFPGETEADFEETLSLVREVGYVDSYSFKYSPRPGTRALELDGQVDPDEAQRRLVELQRVQHELTLDYHFSRVGKTTEILVEGESRRGGDQIRGRDIYHRIVNVDLAGAAAPALGSLLEVNVVEGTPHSLIAALPAAIQ